MKLKVDFKKGVEFVSDAFHKSAEFGKKVSNDVQQKAKDMSNKSKAKSYERRLKKHNPLFPEKFYSEEFNIPNMIIIVDDAEKRDIDVCQGAIGWLSNETSVEILHLYDEEVKASGIQFVPSVTCDAAYYVDKFDRNRFIQTDHIFSKAHEERMAELKHIAYSLGAKRCSIEISESNIEVDISKKKHEFKGGANIKGLNISSNSNSEQSSSFKGSTQRLGKIDVEFNGSDDVTIPKLKWFEHDENIKNLIEMRKGERNSIKSETLVLEGAVSATMSQKTAFAIDNAISKTINAKGKSDMETQAVKENHSKLIFTVEF